MAKPDDMPFLASGVKPFCSYTQLIRHLQIHLRYNQMFQYKI